jgi:hypothetical protein
LSTRFPSWWRRSMSVWRRTICKTPTRQALRCHALPSRAEPIAVAAAM